MQSRLKDLGPLLTFTDFKDIRTELQYAGQALAGHVQYLEDLLTPYGVEMKMTAPVLIDAMVGIDKAVSKLNEHIKNIPKKNL